MNTLRRGTHTRQNEARLGSAWAKPLGEGHGDSVSIADEVKFYYFHHHRRSALPDDMEIADAVAAVAEFVRA